MKIYLLRSGDSDLYKIGITIHENVNVRVKQLQTGNAEIINKVCEFNTNNDYKLETCLHQFYKNNRKEGEWFELTEEMVKGFLNNCKRLENLLMYLKENEI